MKTIKLSVLLAVLMTASIESQAQSFAGVTWKVKEYYLDNMRMGSGIIDSLRYHFRLDGTMEMRQPQTLTTQFLNYTYNPTTLEITISQVNQTPRILKVIHADANNLILTSTDTNPSTGAVLRSEFRMIPVSP